MNNKNTRPLIRKKYSFGGILKLLFSKLNGGKSGGELHIQGFAATIEFRSVASLRDNVAPDVSASGFSRERIISAIRSNDLRGFGGAGFPMADKLETVIASGNTEPVLIINGAECDPGLYHDKWLMENKQTELENIAKILRSAFNLSGVYLAQKTGTPSTKINGITSVDVPDTYPAGEENRLVSWLLGVESEENTYPAQKGIWVQNVQSLLVLYSVLSGVRPLRYITMMDLDLKHAVVVECDIDASVGDLSKKIFGKYNQLYVGGGIMQGYPAEDNKRLNSTINLIAAGDPAVFSDNSCRHCGQCTRYCPADLPVEEMAAEIEKGRAVPKNKQEKCSRCGACSFLCPAGKDLCSLIAAVQRPAI